MSTESIKAISRRWYEELFNLGQLALDPTNLSLPNLPTRGIL